MPPIPMRFYLAELYWSSFCPLVPLMLAEVNAAIELGVYLDLPEEVALAHLHVRLW